MIYEIDHDKAFHYWDENNKPVLTINSGDSVRFETKDCICNVLTEQKSEKFDEAVFDQTNVNPVTGPVYIQGAQPGDTLEVTVEKIEFKDRAIVTCQANYGLIGEYFDVTTYKILPIKNDMMIFNKDLSIPLKPMVGVIGATAKGQYINTNLRGHWGGNMDNTMIEPGAKVYLPIEVEGALCGCGDVHASMGDGEINCSAAEAPAYVTLKFNLRKDIKVKDPVVITDTHFATTASRPTAEAALKDSTNEMFLILKEKTNLEPEEISMLMTSIGNNEVCISCSKTAYIMRFTMPWYALEKVGFKNF